MSGRGAVIRIAGVAPAILGGRITDPALGPVDAQAADDAAEPVKHTTALIGGVAVSNRG